MDYISLQNSLQHDMDRTDAKFIALLPEIIQFGLLRVYNNAKDIGFELSLEKLINPVNTDVLKITSTKIPKPFGWMETLSMFTGSIDTKIFKEILPKSFEYCATYMSSSFSSKTPQFYFDVNTEGQQANNFYSYWAIVPNINVPVYFSIKYRGLPLFNEANRNNFLTERHPQLLLYSCLIEACLKVGNEEKRQIFSNMYTEQLNSVLSLKTNKSENQ